MKKVIFTYNVRVDGNIVKYQGITISETFLFSEYSYEISNGVLEIFLYENGDGGSREINIIIEDERIKGVNKIMIGDPWQWQILWDREHGFRGSEKGIGACPEIRFVHVCFLDINNDTVEFQAEPAGSLWAFSTYSYRIHDNTLYIIPSINIHWEFSTNFLDIEIRDERIRNIEKIILGSWDDEFNRILWDRENGYRVNNDRSLIILREP